MKIISLNVGMPREVSWHGRPVTTGIFKAPVEGRIALRTMNLDGDGQADLEVHGGRDKAVYCYQVANYDYWRKALPERDVPTAIFGENFTVEGPSDEEIYLGDRYEVGTAEVVVTQPRLPCYKLGIRFGDDNMVKRFLSAGRMGFYLRVLREGEVGRGDELKLITADENRVPVSEVRRLYLAKTYGAADLRAVERMLRVDALPDGWREYFSERSNQ